MSDCATPQIRFETPTPLALEAAVDGGRIPADGGLLWLAEADRDLGLCEAIARRVPERRGPSIRHPLVTLVRQRVYQIACVYEDQNDSEALSGDYVIGVAPLEGRLKAAGLPDERIEQAIRGRTNLTGADLSGATLSEAVLTGAIVTTGS